MILKLILSNSGIKSGPLPKADLLIDCRAIPNPFHAPILKGMDGNDPAVIEWVQSRADMSAYTDIVMQALAQIPSRRSDKEDPFADPFRIHFFCAHGIHRSRAMKNIFGKILTQSGYTVEVQ